MTEMQDVDEASKENIIASYTSGDAVQLLVVGLHMVARRSQLAITHVDGAIKFAWPCYVVEAAHLL